jgi:hypothetical protein
MQAYSTMDPPSPTKSLHDRTMEYCKQLNENYDKIIPVEFWDKWCILFGSVVLDSASSFEDALKIHDDMMAHRLVTAIVAPRNFNSHQKENSESET